MVKKTIMTNATYLGNNIKHAMGNLSKARMCIALLVVSAGYSHAQENPSQVPNQANWMHYSGEIDSIDPGEYYIAFREVGTTCISDTVEFEINLPEQPTAPIVSSITQPTCVQATGSVTLSGLPGGNWTINPGNITGSGTTVTITDLVAGQSYAFTVTANNDCTSQPSDTVSIIPRPISPEPPITDLTQSFCGGSLVEQLKITVPTGATPLWYPTDSSTTFLNNGELLHSGTYYAAIVSTEGCESERLAVAVTVNPLVAPWVIIYASDTLICQGTEVAFTAEASNGGSAPVYRWLKNGLPVYASGDSTYTTADLSDRDVISVVLGTNAPCGVSDTVVSKGITIYVSPQITFEVSDSTACADSLGTIVLLDLESSKTYEYSHGSGWVDYADTISGLAPGIHQIVLREKNTTCVSDTLTFSIVLKELPFASISSNVPGSTICAGDTITLFANQADIYLWSTGDTTQSISVSPDESTSYTLRVEKNGCFSELSEISVHVSPIVSPVVRINANKTVTCEGNEVSFTAEVSEGVEGINYQWYLNNEPTGTNSPTFTSSTLNNGDKIRCSVSTIGTCVDETPEFSEIISIEISPKIAVDVLDITECGDEIGFFNAKGLDPNKQYEYQLIPKSQFSKPVITLNGANPLFWPLGETYVDPGAAAYDEKDGVISGSIEITGTVDVNTEGTYQIAYNVTDSDGNAAVEIVRIVNVATYHGWDISSIDDLVMFRDLINTGTCIWKGVPTNTYKGNAIAAGGEGSTWYLTNNINMGSVCGENIGSWKPINNFKGDLNGLGFTISNLYIKADDIINKGLFGTLINSSIVDLHIINASIYGNPIRYAKTGILAGSLLGGNIDKVKIQGVIDVHAYSNDEYAGLLIGSIDNSYPNGYQTSIKNCESLENSFVITDIQFYAGGLIGFAENTTLTNNINRSNVNGYKYTGGIVSFLGRNCFISDCSNYGNIEGVFSVGGIFAYMDFTSSKTFSNCHNYGNILTTGGAYNYSGGLFGSIRCSTNDNTFTIDNCTNSGNIVASGSSVSGILGSYLSNSTSLGNKLFISNCSNDCTANVTSGFSGIFGGGSYIYVHIFSCENRGEINGGGFSYGIGGANIIHDCKNFADIITTAYSAVGIGWVTENMHSSTNFGKITTLNLSNYFNANASGIASIDQYGTVHNCINYGEINSNGKAFGIASATHNRHIENCKNYGEVKGSDVACGIGGSTSTNCENHGNITSPKIAAGIYSDNYYSINYSINNCLNTGKINGGNYSGGIVACSATFYNHLSLFYNITNCSNNNDIIGGDAGGIVSSGYADTTIKITKCINNGNVKGVNVGGIANTGGIITNCINTGDVEASARAGGIAAKSSNYYNCLNTGNIYSSTSVSSGIGSGNEAIGCLNIGVVHTGSTATPPVKGGIVGDTKPNKAEFNYYDSIVAGSIGAFRTVDVENQGEGLPTSSLLGTGLLGKGPTWNTSNWVFVSGLYPKPITD